MLRKSVMHLLLAFCVAFSLPAPAHAGFFLFDFINNIFNGGHKKNESPQPTHQNSSNSSVVKQGMVSSKVAEVQQYLIKANYLGGKADGIFGYQTLQAVKMFQRDSGLIDDGIVGAKTMNVLKNYKKTRSTKSATPLRKPSYTPPKKNTNSGTPEYLYTLPMLVTAYTRYDEGCTDYTYSGTYLRRGLVAVDPDVIPLGTRLFIPGYGEGLADDIGGAIIGNHIDLAMDTQDEAFSWGKKNLTVYVMK